MMKFASSHLRQFCAGFVEMAVATLIVLLVWVSLFGWRGELLSGNDAFLETYLIEHLQAAHGEWMQRPYDHRVMGGVAAHSTYGSVWLYRLGLKMGLSPQGTYNFAVLTLQVLMGLLSLWILRVALSRSGLEGGSLRARRSLEALSFLIFAFLPWWGWRVGYGHAIHLFGFIALPATLYLLLALRYAQAQLWPSLWSILAIGVALSSAGAQILFYALTVLIVLGILIGWGRSLRSTFNWIFPLVLLGLGIIAWSLPAGIEVVSHYLSGATARGDAASPVIYSYLPHSTGEWLKSLTWLTMSEAGLSHPQNFWHEVDLAWGLWFLAALGAWRWKSFRLAFCVYALLGLTIAAITYQWSPISEFLLALSRGLGLPVESFRVPSRWIWVWGYPVQILAWVVIAHRHLELSKIPVISARRPRQLTALSALILLLWVMQFGGWWQELAVLLSLALILGLVSAIPLPQSSLRERVESLTSTMEMRFVGLVVLIFIQLNAFSERLLPMADLRELVEFRDRAKVTSQLHSTERMTMNPLLPGFGAQSIAALHGSGIDGNWIMPKNFLRLLAALEGVPPPASAVIWSFRPHHPSAAWLREVFHVHRHLEMTPQGPQWSGQSPEVSLKIASRIQRVNSWESWPKLTNPAEQARDTLWLLPEEYEMVDPKPSADVERPLALPLACENLQVRDEALNWTSPIIYQAQIESESQLGGCVAISPLGFHSQLRAMWRDADGEIELQTLRAQGAVTAILWPKELASSTARTRGQLQLVWRHILTASQAAAAQILGWLFVLSGLVLIAMKGPGFDGASFDGLSRNVE